MVQIGGGNCTICGSPNTNKSTCPCNPAATKPNWEKHPKWINICPEKQTPSKTTKIIVPVVTTPTKTTTKKIKKIIKSPPKKKITIPTYKPQTFETKEYVSNIVEYSPPKIYKALETPTKFIYKAPPPAKINGDLNLKDIIKSWIGLQNMVAWKINKKYLICKKDEIKGCLIPKDPMKFTTFFNDIIDGTPKTLKKILKLYPNGFSLNELTNNGEKLHHTLQLELYPWFNDPGLDLFLKVIEILRDLVETDSVKYANKQTEKCYMVSNKLLSQECVGIWNTGAVVTNLYDNKKYRMLEKILCPTNCVDTDSYIYQDVLIPSHYFFVFGFGKVIAQSEKVHATIMSIFFILDYLPKYLKPGNNITFVGHSAGFTNGLMISQVLAYSDEDFERLFNIFKGSTSTSLKRLVYCGYAIGKNNYNLCELHNKKYDPSFGPFIIETIKKFKEFRDANINLIKNINFIGSGGAPLLGYGKGPFELSSENIPPTDFTALNSYYNKSIIHFGLANIYKDTTAIDPFLLMNTNNNPPMKNTPIYLLMTTDIYDLNTNLVDVNYYDNPSLQLKNMQTNSGIHPFLFYQKTLALLTENPTLLNPINTEWNKL